MKITTRIATEIFSGLAGLDGYQKVLKSQDGTETSALVPYKIDQTVRRIIYKNMKAVKDEVDEYNKVSGEKFKEISGGRDRMDAEKNPGDKEKIEEYNIENRKLLETTVEVDLKLIKLSRLLCDGNQIPGSVLTVLDPIIEDDLAPVEEKPKEESS